MDDVPVTGKTIIETITKGLRWLDRQIEMKPDTSAATRSGTGPRRKPRSR